jgi:hypothetical protein
VVDDQAGVAVVKRSSAAAIVAEGVAQGEGRTGAVVDAAVDEQAVGSAGVEVALALAGERIVGGRRGRTFARGGRRARGRAGSLSGGVEVGTTE